MIVEPNEIRDMSTQAGISLATFGSGCFWCTEAIFQRIKGVVQVTSGYTGGTVDNPTYREICTGTTGHAEVVQVEYDPAIVAYEDLLQVFWKTHDPTTLNRQGADTGTQYRSVIFYHNEEQRQLAEAYKEQLTTAQAYTKPIVTEILPVKNFYKAEAYHQDYYNANGEAPCVDEVPPQYQQD